MHGSGLGIIRLRSEKQMNRPSRCGRDGERQLALFDTRCCGTRKAFGTSGARVWHLAVRIQEISHSGTTD